MSEKEIFGLDISVNERLVVAVFDSINDRCDGVPGFILIEVFLLDDNVEELSTLHELHHKVEVFSVFENVKQLDDIWVIDVFEDLNLVLQGNSILLVHSFFLDDLDGAELICCFVFCSPD